MNYLGAVSIYGTWDRKCIAYVYSTGPLRSLGISGYFGFDAIRKTLNPIGHRLGATLGHCVGHWMRDM